MSNRKIQRDVESFVRPGDAQKIPAQTMNQLLEGSKAFKRNKFNTGAGVPSSTINPRATCLLLNAGSEIPNFAALRIGGLALDLDDNTPEEIQYRTTIVGTLLSDETDPFVIANEPLENGEFGVGIVSGLTFAYIYINNPFHQWANPWPGTNFLQSVECNGQARILGYYTPPGSVDLPDGVALALVNLIGDQDCEPSGESGDSGDSGMSGESGHSGHSGGLAFIDVAVKICLNPESGIGLRTEYRRLYLPEGTVIGDSYCIDDETECCIEQESFPEPGSIPGCEDHCGAGGATFWDTWHVFIPNFDTGTCSDAAMNQTVILQATSDIYDLTCVSGETLESGGGAGLEFSRWFLGYRASTDEMVLVCFDGSVEYTIVAADFNCDGPNVLTKSVDTCGTDLPTTLVVYPGYP